jgi:hypothetical protein
MIPKRSGDRVKTNRRDSVTLVKLLRARELRAIWVPDTVHEAVRDLTRAREMAMIDLKKKRQQLLSFLLQADIHHPAQQIVFQDQLEVINAAQVRLAALRDRADVDNGPGGGSLPSPAGCVFPGRGHFCRGGGRCTSLCSPATVDGFSRPRSVGTHDW